jgi:CheY-like chemotaxis protein
MTGNEQPYVLVVDDNIDTRDILSRLLEMKHIASRVATDGAKALAIVKEHRPTLIITDLMMPELSGFGFIKEMQSKRELRDIPIIVLSATADDRLAGSMPGVIRTFRKGSFMLNELADLIVEQMTQRQEQIAS